MNYLKELSKDKYNPLTIEEETALLKDYKTNKKAREKLINANLRFVVKCATQMSNKPEVINELILAGNEALCKSLDYFDFDSFKKRKCTRLISYAGYMIRQKMSRTLKTNKNEILESMPSSVFNKSAIIQKCVKDAPKNLTDKELINYIKSCTGYQKDNTIRAFLKLDAPISSHLPVHSDSEDTIEDTLVGKDNVEHNVINRINVEKLKECLVKIPPRYRLPIEMAYGFNGEPKTLSEIGAVFGYTKENARQMIQTGIARLKLMMT